MIKIAVLDDKQPYIDKVKVMLDEQIMLSYKIFEYNTSDDFLRALEDNNFDIVFLDIRLDTKDGIEVGKIINARNKLTNIIFISEYPEYFKDVYKVSHSYFLTKEFEKERFEDAMQKAIKNIERKVIIFNTKKGIEKVTVNNIVYCESNKRQIKIYMIDGNCLEYYANMNDIESLLPKASFLKTHKSFILNMNFIRKFDRLNVYMEQDYIVPISRTYKDEVREKITCYMGGII